VGGFRIFPSDDGWKNLKISVEIKPPKEVMRGASTLILKASEISLASLSKIILTWKRSSQVRVGVVSERENNPRSSGIPSTFKPKYKEVI